MDFGVYLAKKRKLQQAFDATLDLLNELNLNYSAQKLRNEAIQLQNERFNLVVIGEFSRGKSTFVNAMLGKGLLPSSKNATTNVISKIVYGDVPSFKVHFRNGKVRDISEEDFSLIKAQSEGSASKLSMLKRFIPNFKDDVNSINFDSIEYAEIVYPLQFCENNVDVVDTPGTNDLNVGRMEITYNYLKQAEAAILVLCATQPLTKSEKEFLQEQVLGNNIKDIFIVINYKDQVVGEEERVKQHIASNLADLGDFSKRLFMVSSRQALLYRKQASGEILKGKALLEVPEDFSVTGFNEFENALSTYLSEEKGVAKLRKYCACCNIALKEIERDLKIKIDGTYHSADELAILLEQEQPKFVRTKYEVGRIANALRTKLVNHENEIRQVVSVSVNKIREAAIEAAANYQEGMTSSDVKFMVESATTPLYKELINKLNAMQESSINSEVESAVDALKKIWQDMHFDAEAMPIETNSFSVSGIDTGRRINKRQGNAFGGAALGYLLGGWGGSLLFGGPALALLGAGLGWYLAGGKVPFENKEILIKTQIRNQLNDSLKGLNDNICRQYLSSLDVICNNFKKTVDDRIDTMNGQLQLLIQRKNSNMENAEATRKALYEKLEIAKRINDDLKVLSE